MSQNASVAVDVERIERIRIEVGIESDLELDEFVGLSRGHFGRIRERGRCNVETVEKIASALYVRDTDLIREAVNV